METRPAFILGDIFANVLVATIATAAGTWIIGGAWGMVAGVILGMVLGGVIALVLSVPALMTLLGAFEVIGPCTVSGMLGGMLGGMWVLTGSGILTWGAGIGLVVVAIIYTLNAVMTGPRRFEV